MVLFTITITMENLLTFITMLCCAPKGLLGVLEGPRQVLMTSYNMDMVLRWDPPLGGAPQLVYTTEYNTTVNSYKPGCTKTRVLHCDFIAVGIHVSPYGTYTGRVRAHRGLESSAWVESGPLTLDVHTVIGPPNVTLYSSGVHMTVNMGDPVFRISQLRRIYNHASYNITYWKEGEEDTAQSLSVQQNPVVLSDLEPWSRYCVKVRIKTERNHQSQESQVTCEKTTQQEGAPWLEAVVTFVVMAMAVTVVVVAVVYRKKLSIFLCPNYSLPQYFKKNIFETPSSRIYIAMRNYSPPVESYDQVNEVTKEKNTDQGRPLVAEEDHCSAPCQTAEEAQQSYGMCLGTKGEHDDRS